MANVSDIKGTLHRGLRTTEGKLAAVFAAVVLVVALVVASGAATSSAAGATGSGAHLVKATVSDCTSSNESTSGINTSEVLLEALSFVEGNPFFMNPRETLTSPYRFALPTDSYIEKAEWTYDDAGRVATCTYFKSTNPLSYAKFSYDSHASVSKVVGWNYADDGAGTSVRGDFEASFVNEALSSSAYGANKVTVVHGSGEGNDTVVFTYDKDKNLTEISSTGSHEFKLTYTYVTAFKVVKDVKVSVDGADEGVYLVPTYDASNKLVSLKTGTWSGENTTLSGDEYLVQYSGGKVSKVDYYQDDVQVRYSQFSYTDGNLTSVRTYKKGGEQLYNVSLSWK